MAEWKQKRSWWWLSVLLFSWSRVLEPNIAQAKRPLISNIEIHNTSTIEAYRHLFEPGDSTTHVWPDIEFGWRVVLGSVIEFLGAALGSISVVGGGRIFVPMLTLIIGFDPNTLTVISKSNAHAWDQYWCCLHCNVFRLDGYYTNYHTILRYVHQSTF